MTLEYIRQSLFFFRSHFATIARIQLPFIVTLNLAGLLLQSGLEPDSQAMRNAGALLALLNLTLLPVYWGATILFLQSVVDNRPLGALRAVQTSLKYWRRLLLTYIMTVLAVALGLMLLIVPGIYAGVRLMFADYICVLEGRRPTEALRQSWREANDYFGLLLRGILIIFAGLFVLELPFAVLSMRDVDLAPFDTLIGIVFELLGTLVTIYGFRIYCLMKEETAGTASGGEE